MERIDVIWRCVGLVLVFMNAGVALWWALHTGTANVQQPAVEAGVPALRLIQDIDNSDSASTGAELQSEAQALADFSACLRLGPFGSPADVRRAIDQLIPHVGNVQYREAQSTALRGYKVFLPATSTYQQALDNAKVLSSRGIKDYYIITSGPQRNAVSLGIFNSLENAERRRDEITQLGFNPTVESRTDASPEWWIEASVKPDFDWRTVLGVREDLKGDLGSCR
jgi:hypothetical protein